MGYNLLLLCVQGMVDPGERISQTLQREFSEEAMNLLKASASERENIQKRINMLFSSEGLQVRSCACVCCFQCLKVQPH